MTISYIQPVGSRGHGWLLSTDAVRLPSLAYQNEAGPSQIRICRAICRRRPDVRLCCWARSVP